MGEHVGEAGVDAEVSCSCERASWICWANNALPMAKNEDLGNMSTTS